MPPPLPVELLPHSPEWAIRAAFESQRLSDALGPALIAVHHISSTAIPDIAAKPIIDMLLEVPSLDALDQRQRDIHTLGYEWHGEYGIAGRRYCTLTDTRTGKRVIQVHCFETGSPDVGRHLAFRDYLRSHPDKARAYEAEKQRARLLHPDDSHAYTAEKSAFVQALEAEALAELHGEEPPAP